MPTLSPGDWLTLGGMLMVAVGSFAAVRQQVYGIKGTVGEILRQLGALHKRLDDQGRRIGSLELEQARQDERIKGLRNTQRFRMRAATNGTDIGGGGSE